MIDEKKLIEKIDLYIRCYSQPPYGREVEGTVELLKEVEDALSEQPKIGKWIPFTVDDEGMLDCEIPDEGEEVEKRCCETCCHYRTGRCVNGNSRNIGENVDRLWKCREWEGLL